MLINIYFTIHADNKPQNLRLIIRKTVYLQQYTFVTK